MTRLAEVTHVGRQIGGANEQAVDAIERGNLVDGGKTCAALDLQDQADFVAGGLKIVADTAELEARPRAAPTPRIPWGG